MLVRRKFSGNAVRMTEMESRPLYSTGGEEPDVEDLLADPVTRAMMMRDRVREAELRSLIRHTRVALSQRDG